MHRHRGFRLVPFIVTFGTMLVFRGLAEQSRSSRQNPACPAPSWPATLLDPPAGGATSSCPTGVWLVLAAGRCPGFRPARDGVRSPCLRDWLERSHAAALRRAMCPGRRSWCTRSAGLFMALAGIVRASMSLAKRRSRGRQRPGARNHRRRRDRRRQLERRPRQRAGSLVGAFDDDDPPQRLCFRRSARSGAKIVIGGIIVGAVAVDQLTQSRMKR